MPEPRSPRRRNPVARSPLLRKGGPHQRSRSGERQQQHHLLQSELDELDSNTSGAYMPRTDNEELT